MKPELIDFVTETTSRFGQPRGNWRESLFPELSSRDWLDAAVLAGDSVPDLIHEIRAGHVTDSHYPPEVLKAFHLQYPNVQIGFTDFIRQHDHPDELRRIFSGVRGKYFELVHVASLNEHLPDGYVAHLAESATQPGYDVIIEGPDHQYEYLQDKFTSSLSILRRAAERWPDIDIAVPHEVATEIQDLELMHHLIDTGIHGEALNADVAHALDAANAAVDFYFPWLPIFFIVGDEGRQVWRGKSSLRSAWSRLKARLKRTLGSNLIAQGVAVASGDPNFRLLSIPIRLAWARYDAAKSHLQMINSRQARIEAIRNALESGSRGRTEANKLAHFSLLINSLYA